MASREKKPLAPSTKSRQKGSNECTLPVSNNKNKKGKSLWMSLVDTVVTTTSAQSKTANNNNTTSTATTTSDTTSALETAGSNSKLEGLNSRKKVIASLKCKKKLRVNNNNNNTNNNNNNNSGNKNNIIKNKSTRNVPVKNLKRLTNKVNNNKSNNIISGNRKGRPRTVNKKLEEDNNKLSVKELIVDNKLKEEKNKDNSVPSTDNIKQSKKLTELINKSAKTNRSTGNKKSVIDNNTDFKYLKTRKSSTSSSSTSSLIIDCKNNYKLINHKNSVDITIDQVLAMVSDTEIDQITIDNMDKIDGNKTRNDIKKELIDNDNNDKSDEDNLNDDNKQIKRKTNQRSLRNGKLRQLDTNNDTDIKKSRRCHSENDISTTTTNENDNHELKLSESVKEDLEKSKDSELNTSSSSNCNSSNSSNTNDTNLDDNDVGLNLRSKTKVKSPENVVKTMDDVEPEELKTIPVKNLDENSKKSSNLDQPRKDCVHGKLGNEKQQAVTRRSSLNIDIKKSNSTLFNNEKNDEGTSTSTSATTLTAAEIGTTNCGTAAIPKTDIDQMIEHIKLNIKLEIAKTVESRVVEKFLGKCYEVNNATKIEEIITPLSNESKKLNLDEIDDDKLNTKNHNINNNNNNSSNNNNNSTSSNGSSKNNINNESSNSRNDDDDDDNNSIPKVADTAKEIEKLVMGDIESVDHNKNAESAQQNSSKNDNINCSDINLSESKASSNLTSTSPTPTPVSSTSSEQNLSQCKTEDHVNVDDENHLNSSIVIEETANESQINPTELELESKDKEEEEVSVEGDKTTSDEAVKEEEIEEKKEVEVEVEVEKEEEEEEKEEEEEERQQQEEEEQEKEKTEEQEIEKKEENEEVKEGDKETDNKTKGNEKGADVETLESISLEIEKLIAEPIYEVAKQCSKTCDKDDEGVKETGESSSNLESSNDSESSEDAQTKSTRTSSSSSSSNDDTDEKKENIQSSNDSTIVNEDKKDLPAQTVDKNTQEEDEDEDDVEEEVDGEGVTKSPDEKIVVVVATEEVKCNVDEGRRILRTRDKQKKVDKSGNKVVETNDIVVKIEPETIETIENQLDNNRQDVNISKSNRDDVLQVSKIEENEPQIRTRRSREVKKRKDDISPAQNNLKAKRNRRDIKKNEQQNKEETLLDNEVAKINENKRSLSEDKFSKRLEGTESLRVFSDDNKLNKDDDNRSKSENDIENTQEKSNQLQKRFNITETKENESLQVPEVECKPSKSPENLTKDCDAASTSGESTSSVSLKLLETPEDKARKERILRMLGLETLEKAAERMNHQKAKREQYTGTLKTVIRVQKEKEKKRSRSPIKMVLKQGRNDGEGDSPEFYTIQKELGTSGVGDSSSGANRKFSTNHRQSCDEDVEEPTSKERQSLVIPEKSSSFSIHPGRLCADVCCYCFGKFGSLDTPMHLAQLKSNERRQKILNIERHLTKDSCLCDACYRHVDRKANMSPTNAGGKPSRAHRQLLVSKCYVKECRESARHMIKRRWLHKIKGSLQNRLNIDINFEPTQHTSLAFCIDHYAVIEKFLTCALCTRRLARNQTHQLAASETEELNRLLEQQGIPIPLESGTFVCKLCRYYTQTQLKYKDVENMNNNHRSFSKSYRKRILHYNDIETSDNENEEDETQNTKDKRKKIVKTSGITTSSTSTVSTASTAIATTSTTTATTTITTTPTVVTTDCLQSKNSSLKITDDSNSTSDKSTPEPVKIESLTNEIIDNDSNENSKSTALINDDIPIERDNNINFNQNNIEILDAETAIEKLKKRKALDQHLYSTETPIFSENNGDIVEILAMDKEVTLTRLPKRPKLNNDIAPVVQRLGANPSISVRTLFPGEEEMGLHANIEFSNVRELTPQGWEKCATIIQYDRDTKLLWQDLQRPYGNQSSFLRHLILLEKYYRSGDLILAPNASRNAINYSTSVQNRLISYEGPEKMDEPITDPISNDYIPNNNNNNNINSKRFSIGSGGGFVIDRERLSTIPSTSTLIPSIHYSSNNSKNNQRNNQQHQSSSKTIPKILKYNRSGVSITKKPPPNLQRLNPSSNSSSNNSNSNINNSSNNNPNNNSGNVSVKRKEGLLNNKTSGSTSGGKVFELSEPQYKRFQTLKKQKTLMERMNTLLSSNSTLTQTTITNSSSNSIINNVNNTNTSSSSSTSSSPATATPPPPSPATTVTSVLNPHSTVQYQKAQLNLNTQTQFQKHLRMQQEMLNRRSRGDFEPLICDVRPLINENTPAQNLLNNLNLPKSIQVTTKPNNPIPILPKIPKSLTVIPQTVSRSSTTVDK